MCHASCIIYTLTNLSFDEVEEKSILEIGSLDVNGNIKGVIEKWNPAEYIGVDIEEGPNVDRLCHAEELLSTFGSNRFDLVIANELLEHVVDWKTAISNMKGVCKSNGFIIITTRSFGFPFHPYPHDCWRYEVDDMRCIFSDFDIVSLQADPEALGVFIKAKKTVNYQENDLSRYKLYSIAYNKRIESLTHADLNRARVRMLKINKKCHEIAERIINMVFNRIILKIFR